MGSLFYGKLIAQEIQDAIKNEISKIFSETQIAPVMTMIKLDREDSLKMAEFRLHSTLGKQLGIYMREIVLDPATKDEELIRVIQECNQDSAVHGILILLPLPDHIDQDKVLAAICPKKELEGLNENKTCSHFFEGKQSNVLAALFKVMNVLQVNIFQSKCVFIADDSTLKYNAVIKRVLERANSLQIPLTLVSKETPHAEKITEKADILAVSLQTAEMIDKNYIKEGAIVIDFNPILVGEKFCEKRGTMVPIMKSSLKIDSLLTKAKYVLPATGGIGPITLANLMRNFLVNYKRHLNEVQD